MDVRHLQRERLGAAREGVAQIDVGAKQDDRRKRGDSPDGNLKTGARERHVLPAPVRRQVLDRLRLRPANGLVKIAPQPLRRAWTP